MEAAVIILIVVLVITLGVVVFLLLRSLVRPARQPQPGAPGTQLTDPAVLRQQRLEATRQRRVNLERQVAEEEALLFEEEEQGFLRQELKETRQARRQRRQSKGQQKP